MSIKTIISSNNVVGCISVHTAEKKNTEKVADGITQTIRGRKFEIPIKKEMDGEKYLKFKYAVSPNNR